MPTLDVAVRYRDGRKEVVQVGRPADLIAFADKFGHIAPEPPNAMRELAWLTHRALHVSTPLEPWIDELDDLTSSEEVVEKMREELGEQPDPTTAEPAAVATLAPAASSGGE